MLCYIKDMKTFETLSKFDSTEYSLAEGENGQVTIYQKNAIELTTKYVGMWLIINKELYYISNATPNDDSIELVIQSPIYAFERQVVYDGEQTYGLAIKNIIDKNFGVNCPDSEYRKSYIHVTNTDATPCLIESDDYGFIIPYEIFDDALYAGVAIDFDFTNSELNINVYTANYEVASIVFNDGQTTLEGESYDPNFIAKATVLHRLPSQETDPEETTGDAGTEEEEEILYEVIDYYLSSDNHISTTPPQNRAKGIWKYYTAEVDEDPLNVAIGAFSHNNDNHKIEFRSPKKLHLYQSIKMRLRNEIFSTIITSRVLSSDDYRYYYKCGNLATTLTEKIESETGEATSEVKALKKRVNYISNQIEHFDIDSMYPVGSIYMSVNDTNPATLFGGTWEQLQNRFLLGAGSSYTAGSTGGEATHQLTVNEMPSHAGHVYNEVRGGNWAGFLSTSDATSYGSSGRGWNLTAGNELHPAGDSLGGNAAHNNMPPYLVVYIWKRTA